MVGDADGDNAALVLDPFVRGAVLEPVKNWASAHELERESGTRD